VKIPISIFLLRSHYKGNAGKQPERRAISFRPNFHFQKDRLYMSTPGQIATNQANGIGDKEPKAATGDMSSKILYGKFGPLFRGPKISLEISA
jgi:hypothetical protein